MSVVESLVLRCLAAVNHAVGETAPVSVEFMTVDERRTALEQVTAAAARLEHLRLRLIAASGDVADADRARDIATWLATSARTDRSTEARAEHLAAALAHRFPHVAQALGATECNPAQAEAIVSGLQRLPDGLERSILNRAELHLVEAAATFGPRELRVLARRVLDVVAPEFGEETERRALEREEQLAQRATCLDLRRRGDGTTDLRGRVPDLVATRLLTCLQAYTSPRHRSADDPAERAAELRSYDQQLGQAFCALLEGLDPKRLPRHGGDATTVIVTIDLASLRDDLGVGSLVSGSQDRVSAGEVRRLACTAGIVPLVLGGSSEILDLGRTARLFSGGQRKAMAVRDRQCRTKGCEIPAAWCEAHHLKDPWSRGGLTNLDDGALLCRFHHQRIHDPRYHHTVLPDGGVRFHRRR